MAIYLLRDIDDRLYERMRIKSIREKTTLKDVFLHAGRLWVDGKFKVPKSERKHHGKPAL